MHGKLDYVFSSSDYKTTKKKVLEDCAIFVYHEMADIPVVSTLLSDDARQFKHLTYHHAFCWIHDEKNYKKLRSIVPYYKEKLETFLDRYWNFYFKFYNFKSNPISN